MPELTVVVCTLGRPSLGAAIESIAASARASGREVETVVVWQGAEPSPKLDAVRVVEVSPVGLSHARNQGAAHGSAPAVGFVDDDEAVAVGWVETALRELESAAGVLGPVLAANDGWSPYFDPRRERHVFRGRGTAPWVIGTGGNMAFRRAALEQVGWFDPRYGAGAPAGAAEETDLFLRLLAAGFELVFNPELVVFHPARDPDFEPAARRVYAYGMGVALRRSPRLALKYAYTILQALAGARGRARRREVLATLRGFLAGLVSRLG